MGLSFPSLSLGSGCATRASRDFVGMEGLRSNVWSAETLLQGVETVKLQPTERMVKEEFDDPALELELKVGSPYFSNGAHEVHVF